MNVFRLPRAIDSKRRFFEVISNVLPLDPPMAFFGGRLIWDALSDSVWSGLHGCPEEQIAIVWPDPLTLADSDPASFEVALSMFRSLSDSLGDPAATVDSPKLVAVVLGE